MISVLCYKLQIKLFIQTGPRRYLFRNVYAIVEIVYFSGRKFIF